MRFELDSHSLAALDRIGRRLSDRPRRESRRTLAESAMVCRESAAIALRTERFTQSRLCRDGLKYSLRLAKRLARK